ERSAPTHLFKVPDFRGLSEGLERLAFCHTMVQLNLAVHYWWGSAALDGALPVRNKKEAKRRQDRIWRLLRLDAYRFVVNADAWRLVCAGLHVDPEQLLRGLPGYDMLTRMEKAIRPVAFSPTEALAFLRDEGDGDEQNKGESPAAGGEC